MQIGNKSFPVKDVMTMFDSTGLSFEGAGREGIVRTIQDALAERVGSMAPSTGNILQKGWSTATGLGRKISDFTDTYFRLSQFMDGLAKGLTPEGAANWVRQYHVDYSDITMFEKNVMKRFFPYYTFVRKNVPQQFAILIDNPGVFTGLANLVRASSEAIGDPAQTQFLESNFAIPIYDAGDKVVYFNWNPPMADLARFQTNYQDTLQEFVSMLHPALRVPIELAINRSLSTWQPIRETGRTHGQQGRNTSYGRRARRGQSVRLWSAPNRKR